jgi:hypothetical protein
LATVPTAGVTVQFTPVLPVPLTVAVNVADWPEVSEALDGVIAIDTGTSDITALALLPVDAWLVAVTVTVCADEIGAGAV